MLSRHSKASLLAAVVALQSHSWLTSAQCESPSQDVSCMFSETILAPAGSYNSLTHQVAFCKMQGFDTVSRETSMGPSVFTSGLVHIGVGLSHDQFGSNRDPSWLELPEGAAVCGMCLEVTKVENMPKINAPLTEWDYAENISTPFLAMVFDQCKDPICDQTGYLDFDVYNDKQPVEKGNPRILEWRAVDCPVGDQHKLEYLVCTPGTCNQQDSKDVPAWGDVMNPDFFTVMVRNHRLPIIKFEIEDPDTQEFRELPFITGLGWNWSGKTFNKAAVQTFKFRVTAADNQAVIETFDRSAILNAAGEPAYRGGLLLHGKEQFQPSAYSKKQGNGGASKTTRGSIRRNLRSL